MAGGSGEVETLYLGCNGITAGGACRIADQLRASPQVVTGVWLKRNPLGKHADNPKHHHVMFLSARPDPKLVAAVDPADYEPEMFELHGRELFMWWPAGAHKARLTHSFWERKLKVTATARNWNTVQRLLEMAAGDDPV